MDKDTLELTVGNDLYVTIPRGQYERLESFVEIDNRVIAPVKKGQQEGVLRISLSNENLVSVPLLANEEILKGNIFSQLKDEIHLMLFD